MTSNFLVHLDSNKNVDSIESPLEKVLEESLDELGITDVVWVPTKNGKYFQVYFSVELYSNDATLQYLQSKGFGLRSNTSIGYIPFGLYFCNEDEDLEEELNEMGFDRKYS